MPANEVKIKNCAAFFTFSFVATIGKGDFPQLIAICKRLISCFGKHLISNSERTADRKNAALPPLT